MTEDIKIEETKENPVVEEPTVENPPDEPHDLGTEDIPPKEEGPKVEVTNEVQAEKETPTKETDTEKYSERERRYYARMKEAEKQAKEAKEALNKAAQPVSDVDAILEVQHSTKDLDPAEIEELKLRASAKNLSLSDARKDGDFLLWQAGYKEKVAKENVPLPSDRQPEAEKPKTLNEQLAAATTIEEKQKILEGQGLYQSPKRSKQRLDFMK